MPTHSAAAARPPIHVLADESDVISNLALRAEKRLPVVSAMLLEEIERAELHEAGSMPAGYVQLNSHVTFVDEKSGETRDVQLVLPADADIAKGRISIMTPMGAALYGLAKGHSIDWPDLFGNFRAIRVAHVAQSNAKTEATRRPAESHPESSTARGSPSVEPTQ